MKLESIQKIYHNQHDDIEALSNIDLCIQNIGMTFIIGSSGCGKTTLLNIISGKDKDFTGTLEREGSIEVIEQDVILFESMKVIDNLLLVSDDRPLIDEWLDKFEMKEFINQKVHKLSIGQKKRIQVIRSLLVESDYLICDEPTASLDYQNAQLIMQVLQTSSSYKSVIIVTHEIALVEEYADRVITMNKGKIIDDEEVHQQKMVTPQNISQLDKKMFQQFLFFIKDRKAHTIETFVKLCLVSLILIVAFVSTSLFSSTREAVIEKNKWRNSENIIMTQPREGNNQYRGHDDRVEETGEYFYYDVYDKESIQLVKDNVKGVIGYRYGWEGRQYSLTRGSFAPEMTFKDIQKAVKEGDRLYKETGKIPYVQYEDYRRILNEIYKEYPQGDFSNDFVLTSDFRNYEGFKDNSMDNVPGNDIFKIGFKNNIEVVPYQLYDSYQIPLKYGKLPQQNNEMIVSYQVADELLKEYQKDDYNQLLNQEISFSYLGGQETKMRICGISYDENKNENQVYFKEGGLDYWIETTYEMNPDKLKYLYVDFLIDPQYETKEIANDINNILEGKESQFVPYNESFLTESTGYQNPMYFYIFSALACLGLFIIEAGTVLMNRKRLIKEEYLLRHYGYSPLFNIFNYIFSIFIIAVGIQTLLLPSLCPLLNHFVNTLGFASFIEYDLIKYLLSGMISLLIFIVIEGGLYAFRTQKHS